MTFATVAQFRRAVGGLFHLVAAQSCVLAASASGGARTRALKTCHTCRFLYALSSPLGRKKRAPPNGDTLFLARPKGLEPLTS